MPLQRIPFSTVYLPILAPEFTEQGQEEAGKGLKIPYLWRESPPHHPFQTGSSRSLDAYGRSDDHPLNPLMTIPL